VAYIRRACRARWQATSAISRDDGDAILHRGSLLCKKHTNMEGASQPLIETPCMPVGRKAPYSGSGTYCTVIVSFMFG
jgi:hypothetical protein